MQYFDAVGTSKVFVASTNDVTSGTGGQESPRLLIKNPTGSGKIFQLIQLTLTTNVSTNNNIFRFYANPTITNDGTLLTARNMFISRDGLSSVMEVYRAPTTSSNGAFMMNYIVGATSSLQLDLDPPIFIGEGQSLVITVRPNTGSVTHNFNVFWIEK